MSTLRLTPCDYPPTPLWKILATPLITDDVKWSIRAKNVAYEAQPSVSLIFLAHSEVFCDLLLNRPAAWWRNKLLSTLTSSIRLSYYRWYETFFLEIERVTGLFIDRNKTLHSPLILEKSASAVPMNDVIFHKLYICNLRAKFTRINWILKFQLFIPESENIFIYIFIFRQHIKKTVLNVSILS